MPEPIQLFVYDLSNGLAQSLGPMLVGRPVEGIWHTSIVLYGIEIWFGQGIHAKSPPGTTHHGAPRKRIAMGDTQLDRDTFFEYIEGMRETYKAERYHLLEFNCNHFTNDVIGFLNGRSIPTEILDQPRELMATPFGQQMRPMIEQMFVGSNTRSAGDAVNNLLPSLAQAQNSATQSRTSSDTPSMGSVASNLQIVTSAASLRTTLARSKATALMFTSSNCPPCAAIKPYFEELARTHPSITCALVETGLGEGSQIAQMTEFGGPVSATPTFCFFVGTNKVGECRGADRKELETRIGMLALEVFPPHPHEKLNLPKLAKLSKSLAPITYTSFPPLTALASKLASSTTSLPPNTSSILSKVVTEYLSSLPIPPAAAPTTALPSTLLEPWLDATATALSTLSTPGSKFPVVDLLRLALARDAARLSTSPEFLKFLPSLISTLVEDLDVPEPDHPYLLTAIKLVSNLLISPILVARVLSKDCLPNVTKLLIRALLDEKDDKTRTHGAGLAWSIVTRIFARRIGNLERGNEETGELVDGVSEEWETELAGAVLEALGREEKSLEVVHRLAATLGLLVYRSPFHEESKSLLEVLEAKQVLAAKKQLAHTSKEQGKDVIGVLEDPSSPSSSQASSKTFGFTTSRTILSDTTSTTQTSTPSQSSSSSASKPPLTGTSSSSPTNASPSSKSSSTPNPTSSIVPKDLVDILLKTHNDFRVLHQVEPLDWNETLAESSDRWVDHCVFEHSGGKLLEGGYGENLFASSGTGSTEDTPVDGKAGVDSWNDEIKMYTYSPPTGFTHETGHVTQTLWKGTKTVGCQFKNCKGLFTVGQWGSYLVCQYYPPGEDLLPNIGVTV
ncbi:uncharacterized protein JCM15063_002659 [Sporobolomyces koalae]|uniref:uncharacterized protein n=1 Tax=Sporobolomyces koalae TaxID=500713 RepID=UPI00317BAB30